MVTPMQPVPVIAYLCLAASMALVGVYVGLSKPLLAVFPVMLLAWLRYTIAAIPMVTWLRRSPEEAPLTLRNSVLLAVCAFIGSFLFTLSMLTGVKFTSALSAGIVMAGIPAAVALLSRIFLHEHISRRTLAAIACSVSGIALLAIANLNTTPNSNSTIAMPGASIGKTLLGHLLLITSVFCEASYVVIGKQLSGQVSPRRISAYLNFWGWIFSMPAGIYLLLDLDFPAVGWINWGLLVFYALCASIVTVMLWMTGLKSVPAASAGIFTSMIPISAAVVSIFLGEHFSKMHGIALLLALAGIALATWPKRLPCTAPANTETHQQTDTSPET